MVMHVQIRMVAKMGSAHIKYSLIRRSMYRYPYALNF